MSLDDFSTDELRAEIHRRERVERAEQWEKIRVKFRCPECGGDPKEIDTQAVNEHRQAPRDAEGHPMLYAPYDDGETFAVDYERTVTCVNGHETRTTETKVLKEPRKGPPMLGRTHS